MRPRLRRTGRPPTPGSLNGQRRSMSDGQEGVHHGSHRKLLWSSPFHHPLPRNGIDAIIVPTTRGPDHLLNAMRLAAELGCVLVTLHSKHDTTAVQSAQLLDADIDLMTIDITSS